MQRRPSVFVFNPFAEGYMAHGSAFAPVKHQGLLAEDLASLPQFLCEPGDVVLVAKRPSVDFQKSLGEAGFREPRFAELSKGRIDPASDLCRRELGGLRPWAWGPDSVELLEPLLGRVTGRVGGATQYFNDDIARLYSKAWSADFLRKILTLCHAGKKARNASTAAVGVRWLCSDEEVGVEVSTLEDALKAIAAIRSRGHHRVVAKQAYGLAGHNAIRLWEPDLLPAQRQWLAASLGNGRQLVVEPWLDRQLDFSVQLEMGPRGLELCGYTGLVNDLKGQFLANWAEADHRRSLPAAVAASLTDHANISERLQEFYSEILRVLEAELRKASFAGPVSIDAFVYRTPQGETRVKPVVEINPRHTMGRLTVELMKHASPGNCGLFRLVTRTQARAKGFDDFVGYAHDLKTRLSLSLTGEGEKEHSGLAGEDARVARTGDCCPRILRGALCLNDPKEARVCLATFEVSPALHLPPILAGDAT
jgi:hypothetical protein